MKINIIIGSLILIILLLLIWKRKKPSVQKEQSLESNSISGENKIVNDKLILVENITSDEISRILSDFCNMYELSNNQILVNKISDTLFGLTFPKNFNFENFCILINYIQYPKGFNKQFTAKGWATVSQNDLRIDERNSGRQVMLYISKNDNEYDNVLMINSEQILYKLSFNKSKALLINEPSEIKYTKSPYTITEEGLINP